MPSIMGKELRIVLVGWIETEQPSRGRRFATHTACWGGNVPTVAGHRYMLVATKDPSTFALCDQNQWAFVVTFVVENTKIPAISLRRVAQSHILSVRSV